MINSKKIQLLYYFFTLQYTIDTFFLHCNTLLTGSRARDSPNIDVDIVYLKMHTVKLDPWHN